LANTVPQRVDRSENSFRSTDTATERFCSRRERAGRGDVGEEVEAGQTIATIEAMKMEAAVTAPKAEKSGG
jgi:predicted deacylase